jgi:hypothetical protein
LNTDTAVLILKIMKLFELHFHIPLTVLIFCFGLKIVGHKNPYNNVESLCITVILKHKLNCFLIKFLFMRQHTVLDSTFVVNRVLKFLDRTDIIFARIQFSRRETLKPSQALKLLVATRSELWHKHTFIRRRWCWWQICYYCVFVGHSRIVQFVGM